jgi:hypothetical protein
MKAADLSHFFVVCALVSDLNCPGYNPRQSLAKDSDLARTAARHRVDTAKMVAAVRAELSKTKTNPKGSTKPTKNPGTPTGQRAKPRKASSRANAK